MMTDFKISEIKTDKGTVSKIRIYEGDITTENEYSLEKRAMVPVIRYRRTKMIGEKTITYDSPVSKDSVESDVKAVIKKDKKRKPIPEQK